MSAAAADDVDVPRTVARSTVWRLAVGTVAILLWGLVFDQLTRVGGWILDTYNVVVVPPLVDLHSRYRDVSIAIHKGNLYAFRHGAFTYPPITAYLFWPFHLIGWHATAILWTVANVVVLALLFTIVLWRFFSVPGPTAWLVSATGLAPATIFLLYPFRSLLYWGQLGLFLMFLVFVDLFVVPTRFRGMLIGVAAAVKLLPAIFIVWLLARREFPGVVRVVGAFLVLTVFAAVLWPHASVEYWFHVLPSGRDVTMATNPTNLPVHPSTWFFGVGKVINQSLRGMLGRPPISLPGTMPWAILAVAVLALGIVVTLRQLAERRDLLAFVTLSLVTVLVSPVSWLHYWVFVGLAPFVAILEWRRDRVVAIASIILTVATCANLEDPRLEGLTPPGIHFLDIAPIVVFGVRNLYVLGGLVYLGLVAWRAFATQTVASASTSTSAMAEEDRSTLTPSTP
jgi:alpha-1,2-mannosyltransferase